MVIASMRTNNDFAHNSHLAPMFAISGCHPWPMILNQRPHIPPSTLSEIICTLPRPKTDQTNVDLPIIRNQTIHQFLVHSLLGKGSFGHVLKCTDCISQTNVAVKILNPETSVSANIPEIDFLKYINDHDTENYFVKCFGDFMWKGYRCVVFELLGENLYDYLRRNNFEGMTFVEVHQIAYQLSSALARLDILGIIHCDLKPENIALSYSAPGRKVIKIIDFGSSCMFGGSYFRYVQSRFYRAIEVVLDIGYDKMIDTWSVACVLIEILVGHPIFPGSNEQEQLIYFIQTLGPIPDNMLSKSTKSSSLLYGKQPNSKISKHSKPVPFATPLIDTIMNSFSVKSFIIQSHNKEAAKFIIGSFVNFVAQMLIYDPVKRLVPGDQMLSHPFLISDVNISCSSLAPSLCSIGSSRLPDFHVRYSGYHPDDLTNAHVVHNSGYLSLAQPIIHPPVHPNPHGSYISSCNPNMISYPRYLMNYGLPYRLPLVNSDVNMHNQTFCQNGGMACNLVVPPFMSSDEPPCSQCSYHSKCQFPPCPI